MKRAFRLGSLILILLVGPALFIPISLQGMTMTNWFYPVALLVWLLLFGLWYLVFGKQSFWKRLGRLSLVVSAFLLLGFLASRVLDYQGSASGSSFPKFSWVWDKKIDAENENSPALLEAPLTVDEERIRNAAEDYTDFLGPDRDGMWKSLPFDPDWSSRPPELLWRRTVGKGWSSFVVKEGKAITQEQVGDAERITCLDLATGKEIWHHDNADTRLLLERIENSGARMGGDGPRSTPAIHNDRVYAVGSTGVVNCLDLATGNSVWDRHVIREYGGETQKWGIANAPLILPGIEAVVIAGTDRIGGADGGVTLVAFDLATGEERWKYRGKGASYSSPRLLSFFGSEQIVTVNAGDVAGLDPATGKELWAHEWKGNFPKVGQPLKVGDDKLLVTASYGVGSPLLQLSKKENKWQTEQLWKSTRMKTKFSSAVILNEIAYGLDEGRLAAIDLVTGDKVWKNQKYGFGQQLLFADHLLIQTEKGPVVTGVLGPDGFTEISRLEALEGMTWNAPTVAGRILLVRNDKEAACYLLPEPR